MEWNVSEVELVSKVVDALQSYCISRSTSQVKQELHLSRKYADDLKEGIPIHADGQLILSLIPVRHLFRLLGFSESHPFQWRLEHKLVQALVLQSFCPEAMPVTTGLTRYIAEHPDRDNKEKLQQALDLCFLKPALGHSSLHQNKPERDYAVDKIWRERAAAPDALLDETWIVQEKIAIVKEYRVHSLEDEVVEDLTYVNRLHRVGPEERGGPNGFVSGLLKRLPNAFVSNCVIGWDIAEVEGGGYRVIETNWAGFHPVATRGFQCSGLLSQPVWGPYVTARLIEFIENKYQVTVVFDETIADTDELGLLYWWIAQWKQLFAISRTATNLGRSMEQFAAVSSQETKAKYADAEQLLSQLTGRFRRIVTMLE